MNERSDMDHVLRHWFESGPSTMPDRVVDVVADRIGRERQRRAWRLRWRPYEMNSTIKIAAAVAAVLVLAVVAVNIMPGGSSRVGGPASPGPTSSPIASASPSAAAGLPEWYTAKSDGGSGILPAGTHTTRSFKPGSTFRVPEGWVNDIESIDLYRLFPDSPANAAEFARYGRPGQVILMGIVDTPTLICDEVGVTAGSTAAELAASLVANKHLVTSEPVKITVGDMTGVRVDSHLDPGWTGTCPPHPDDPPGRDYKDYRGRFIFLDAPDGGKLLIVVDSVTSADFGPLLDEAMPIVESFRFDLTS